MNLNILIIIKQNFFKIFIKGTNSAGYEFQGWGRISTYVKAKGNYILHCYGVHTIYVRNDNLTRTLIGDVYQSGQVKSIIGNNNNYHIFLIFIFFNIYIIIMISIILFIFYN